jgi:hypothetical protein
MNKPFLRARQTDATALYMPMAWAEVPVSTGFHAAARSWQHRDITSAGLHNRIRTPGYTEESRLRAGSYPSCWDA